jgi:hypothetical protein
VYTGHAGRSLCAAAVFVVSRPAAGQLVLAGGEDGRALLWDVSTRRVAQALDMGAAAAAAAGAAAAGRGLGGGGGGGGEGGGAGGEAMEVEEGGGDVGSGGVARTTAAPPPCGAILAAHAHPTRDVLALGESAGGCGIRVWADASGGNGLPG